MRVKLSKKHLKILFNKIVETSGNWTKIASEQGISVRTFSDWRRGKITIPFEVFKRLSDIAEFNKDELSPKLLPNFWYIKDAARKGALVRYKKYGNPGTSKGRSKGGITTCRKLLANLKLARELGFLTRKKIYLPQKSPKLAELIGVLMGDGGITNYQVRVTLNKETDKEYAHYIIGLFKDLFHLKSTLSERKGEKIYEVVASCRNLVEFLLKLGLKKGNKIKQQIDIPKWILKNKRLKSNCLRGLVDTDGCFYVDIHKIKNKYYFNPGIDFCTHSLPLFLSVKKILEDLNYHPTGEKTHIRLRRENEIIRYFKEVGSSNSKHILKFKNFLKTYRK